MTETPTLYDEDFCLWSRQQAEALHAAGRNATNQRIDWENVAEEIESLGRSDKRELARRLRRIIEHLLKLEFSRAGGPRAGWIDSIEDARNEIDVLLVSSPSLRAQVAGMIPAERERALRRVIRALECHGEFDPPAGARIRTATYTEDQILGDWFPPVPTRGK